MSKLLGYSDRLSVAPGERISFMVSSPRPNYEASIVRLIHGDANPAGPGYREEIIGAVKPLRPGREQAIRPGSHVEVGDAEVLRALETFTLALWIWPTTPGDSREQGLVTKWSAGEQAGYALVIGADGCLRFRTGRGARGVAEVGLTERLRRREWYFVAATYDAQQGVLVLSQFSLSPWANPKTLSVTKNVDPGPPVPTTQPLLMAAGGARDQADAHFNGKLDHPSIYRRALASGEIDELRRGSLSVDPAALVAAWNLGAEPATARVSDSGRHALAGRLVNMPARAVTGHNWSGRESDFRLAPSEYGAIHFHADDLEDAGWAIDLEWSVPRHTKSGVYAMRLRTGGDEDRIPFVVRPVRKKPDGHTAILVLLPTMTYLAYANLPLDVTAQRNRPPDWQQPPEPVDDFLNDHAELGASLYQIHRDGSGIIYASALRPILTMRPTYRASFINAARHLPADLYLIDWLEAAGHAYDVITDQDLHADQDAILAHYQVVVTGSHPEYVTCQMVEALERYVHSGGRLMYLGGNGFYWVTSVDAERPHVIEVRRGIAGCRAWESEPGELHHSTTGELGGLWRYRGALPNRLLGVGFSAQGVGSAGGYRRTPQSFRDDLAFIFEGIGCDEVIGNFGLVMDSAVGDELDREDALLGTPPQACVVASSVDVGKYYDTCIEDRITWLTEREGGKVRADIVYLENANGGAVFSVGSIAWSGSLSHSGHKNNVSRITENVLVRFAGLPSK